MSGLLLVLLSVPALVEATSDPGNYELYVDGVFLGESSYSVYPVERTEFPANPAILIPGEIEDSLGSTVALVPHPSLTEAWQPSSPLAGGVHFVIDSVDGPISVEFESTGVVDDTPPPAPTVGEVYYDSNESSGGCGRNEPGVGAHYPQLSVAVQNLVDDLTPSERITLAFYSGETAGEAQTTDEYIRMARHPGGRALIPAAAEWFTVTAIDLAGNESPRSDPFTYER